MAAVVIAPHPHTAPSPARSGRAFVALARSAPSRTPTPVRRLDASVYRRRRLVALAMGAVSLLVLYRSASMAISALSGLRATPAAAEAPSAPVPMDRSEGDIYVVEPGDTLWSIASRTQPDADPRPIVDALAERLGGASLQPGQRLRLDGLR